jgi:hypothetical protein
MCTLVVDFSSEIILLTESHITKNTNEKKITPLLPLPAKFRDDGMGPI